MSEFQFGVEGLAYSEHTPILSPILHQKLFLIVYVSVSSPLEGRFL